ncbi:MAG: hypothetical protein ACOYJ1_06860 [Peptococcales bacterium]|jgi:hypothetical protein
MGRDSAINVTAEIKTMKTTPLFRKLVAKALKEITTIAKVIGDKSATKGPKLLAIVSFKPTALEVNIEANGIKLANIITTDHWKSLAKGRQETSEKATIKYYGLTWKTF